MLFPPQLMLHFFTVRSSLWLFLVMVPEVIFPSSNQMLLFSSSWKLTTYGKGSKINYIKILNTYNTLKTS